MIFLARGPNDHPLYWLTATSNTDARRIIDAFDLRRPVALRGSFPVGRLQSLTYAELMALPRTLRAAQLKV